MLPSLILEAVALLAEAGDLLRVTRFGCGRSTVTHCLDIDCDLVQPRAQLLHLLVGTAATVGIGRARVFDPQLADVPADLLALVDQLSNPLPVKAIQGGLGQGVQVRRIERIGIGSPEILDNDNGCRRIGFFGRLGCPTKTR